MNKTHLGVKRPGKLNAYFGSVLGEHTLVHGYQNLFETALI
jgi:hypothetical protein